MPDRPPTSLTLRRAALAAYWLLLFTGTHWPRLEIRSELVERPDLFMHLAVFGALAAFLIAAAFFGRALSPRNVLIAAAHAAAYATADEASQLIPLFGRHAAWDDLAANLGGIAVAAAVSLGLNSLLILRRATTGPA